MGYSRAIRVGNVVELADTTSMDGDMLIGRDDVYEQMLFILKKNEKALLEVDATLQNVIHTRMYVTNIEEWEQVGKAHAPYFGTIKSVATMV